MQLIFSPAFAAVRVEVLPDGVGRIRQRSLGKTLQNDVLEAADRNLPIGWRVSAWREILAGGGACL